MVQAVRAFLEFCYLARRPSINADALHDLNQHICLFHNKRSIFQTTGVRNSKGLSLPRQHSMSHYPELIQEFGAPNGLCSSITESKHIKAVKQTYRRSSKNRPLGQMLLANQRLDKLHRYRVELSSLGMLDGLPLGLDLVGGSSGLPLAASRQPHGEGAEDSGALPGERVQSEVKLAKTRGTSFSNV